MLRNHRGSFFSINCHFLFIMAELFSKMEANRKYADTLKSQILRKIWLQNLYPKRFYVSLQPNFRS